MKGFLYLVYFYFHQGVVQPEFELTSPIKKSTEVKVVDRFASN